MARFSARSLARLAALHPRLRLVIEPAIGCIDFIVGETIRTPETQAGYVARGVSRTMNSKHLPDAQGFARAADCAPYPVDYAEPIGLTPEQRRRMKVLMRFVFMQGVFKGIAHMQGVEIRQGIDWDDDEDFTDQTFDDYPHIELQES